MTGVATWLGCDKCGCIARAHPTCIHNDRPTDSIVVRVRSGTVLRYRTVEGVGRWNPDHRVHVYV